MSNSVWYYHKKVSVIKYTLIVLIQCNYIIFSFDYTLRQYGYIYLKVINGYVQSQCVETWEITYQYHFCFGWKWYLDENTNKS